MLPIVCFVFGIIALVKGRFTLSAKKVVEGAPAYVVGVLLLLPLPIEMAIGFMEGFSSGLNNRPMDQTRITVLSLISLAFWLVAVVVVSLVFAKEKGPEPGRRRRDQWPEDDEGDWRPRKRRREDDDEGELLEPVPELPPVPREAIQVPAPTPLPAPAVPIPAPPEAITVACGGCQALCRVPASAAGKQARCPKCQAIFRVPGPGG